MRMNDPRKDSRPFKEIDHGPDRIGQSAHEERLDEGEAVTACEQGSRENPAPAQRQVQAQPKPLGQVIEKDRFQRDAGNRSAPDQKERPPPKPAAKENPMRRRKRAGNEDEDRTMIESFHDLMGGASSNHHVTHTAQ